jgi:hypothetical protein
LAKAPTENQKESSHALAMLHCQESSFGIQTKNGCSTYMLLESGEGHAFLHNQKERKKEERRKQLRRNEYTDCLFL